MGACTSCARQERREIAIRDRFDQEPQDTIHLKDTKFPLLSFSAQLTKMKIKRCSYPSLSMKFSVQDVEQFLIPTKDFKNQTAKWDVQHIFMFQMTQYQMRRKFLLITFIDKSQTTVGNLKINFYMLATGPFHQDFALSLQKDNNARLSFNFKISQLIKMKFQILQAQTKPIDKQYPGDKFAFSVRSIMGHTTQYTNQSYTISIAFDQQQYQKQKKLSESISQNLPKKRKLLSKKSVIANLTVNQKEVDRNNIKWSKQICYEMPEFKTQIPLYDMHAAAFHIIYWKVNKLEPEVLNEQDDIRAQCYVSINKLLNFQSTITIDPDTNIPYQERLIHLQQKNWSHGKQVGVSILTMRFWIQKHLKQMQVCVRTQQGILKSSPVFTGQQKKQSGNPQIQQLVSLSARIDSQFIQLARNEKADASLLLIRKNIQRIQKFLTDQKQLLMTTVKQSILFFNYKNEKELLKAQQQLIALGMKTLSYIDQNRDQISATSFALLSALAKRGEMSLFHMGFNNQKMSQNIDASFNKKKIQIALKYQGLLNHLLSSTLKALNIKGHQTQKQFAELFCAIAYFRIPQFRRNVLKSIGRQDDPDIQEWRGTQFDLYANPGSEKFKIIAGEQRNTFSILFDWENGFYKYIENQQDSKKKTRQLQEILSDSQWEARIQKRGGAFYSFVRYWCEYIQTFSVNSKHLKWKYFPGYNKILHAFLVQMKRNEITQYSDRLQRACVGLLNNQKLLNTFVVIVFKKSNINDPLTILKLLQLLDQFFKPITSKKRIIPTTFDYNYFVKGFKMILQSKALLLLYNHWTIISSDFKFNISMYLLGKQFFKLFLHWSKNVRAIFQHLLYIRIYKLSDANARDTIGLSRQQINEIKLRYQKVLIVLQNANDVKKQIVRKQGTRFQPQLYKKMKKKLRDIKNRKSSVDNESEIVSSMAKLTNNPRKNSQADNRMIQELSKPKLQRYQSEMMNQNLKIAIQQARQKKDEIIQLKSNHNMKGGISEQNIYLTEKDLPNSLQAKKSKRVNLFSQQQMNIWPMTKNETQYLQLSLLEYKGINQMFLKHIQKNKNPDSVPIIKLQMAFDYQQIRPEGIQQW